MKLETGAGAMTARDAPMTSAKIDAAKGQITASIVKTLETRRGSKPALCPI
jgi:hypothetical protein